jgi:uncharacterized protein (DUF2147 family)
MSMPRFKWLAIPVLWALGSMPVMAASAEDAFGTWRHPDNGSLVKLYSCPHGLCAKIVKVMEAGARDVHNPDPEKRDRPVEGLLIMNGAAKVGADQWRGTLYNREDGQTYAGKVIVVNKNELRLEGCILAELVCKGVTWTRVAD